MKQSCKKGISMR